jgi:hypothetical protein
MHFTFHHTRLFEWLSSMMIISMALIEYIDPRTINRGGFYLISHLGMTSWVFYILTCVFGSMRIVALVANGMSVWWGPRIRMLVSLVSAVIWSQMAYSLIVWSVAQDYLSLGIPIFTFLAVGELVSSHRAAVDAKFPVH